MHPDNTKARLMFYRSMTPTVLHTTIKFSSIALSSSFDLCHLARIISSHKSILGKFFVVDSMVNTIMKGKCGSLKI